MINKQINKYKITLSWVETVRQGEGFFYRYRFSRITGKHFDSNSLNNKEILSCELCVILYQNNNHIRVEHTVFTLLFLHLLQPCFRIITHAGFLFIFCIDTFPSHGSALTTELPIGSLVVRFQYHSTTVRFQCGRP